MIVLVSIAVPVEELGAASAEYGLAYLLTTSAAGRPRVLAVRPTWSATTFVLVGLGRSTAANVARTGEVTLLWPPRDESQHTLIVDGTATVDVETGRAVVVPSGAVLHVARAAGPA